MSTDVNTKQIENIERYNFINRIVCKFQINSSKEFWGQDLQPLSKSYLVPENDIFYDFMKNEIKSANV